MRCWRGRGTVSTDNAYRGSRYRGRLTDIRAYLVTAMVLLAGAGVAVAALISHVLPHPVALPNNRENDGSLALAYVIFIAPLASWVAWRIGRVRGGLLALVAFCAGLGVAFIVLGVG